MGDFNLHVDTPSSDVRQFSEILESFDLDQRMGFPIHIHGHSLDLIIFSNRFDVESVSVGIQEISFNGNCTAENS